MDLVLETVKVVCLFLMVWMTPINIAKMKRGQAVSTANLFYQAIGITGFIYLQWLF